MNYKEMLSIIRNGKLELIETIITFNPANGVDQLLNIAIEEKKIDMARVILKSGKISQDDIQYWLICKAIPRFNKEAFDLLTEFGANINAYGIWNIYDCFQHINYCESIKFALDNGLDVNVRNKDHSLLQYAVRRNKIDITQLFIDHPKTDIYKYGNDFHDNESFEIVKRERIYRSIQATNKILPIDLRRLLLNMLNGVQVENKRMRRVE